MNLVKYSAVGFQELSAIPTTLLQSTGETIFVDSITICNLSKTDTIFVTLQLVQEVATPIPIVTNLINSVPVLPSGSPQQGTLNLISEFDLKIFLNKTPQSTDTLVCFTNGHTEEFDCAIFYTTFER